MFKGNDVWDKKRILGAKLAEVRKKRNWTVRDVEKQIGLSRSGISRWEAGERNITVFELWALCQIYEIDFFAFVEDVMSHPARVKSQNPA